MTRLTGDGSVPLLRLAQFGDADIVVEHGPDLLLVGNELIAEDHLFLGVVEAAHLYARKSDSLNERRCLFSDHTHPQYLKVADLHVQRKRVEHHRADERDARCHSVHYLGFAAETVCSTTSDFFPLLDSNSFFGTGKEIVAVVKSEASLGAQTNTLRSILGLNQTFCCLFLLTQRGLPATIRAPTALQTF